MMIEQEFLRRCADGSDIHEHLPRLYEEACRPGVRVIELGVRSGNSTAAFLRAITEYGGELWSVDIGRFRLPEEWFTIDGWHQLIGDDLELVDQLPDDVDVLFIDTSHTYDQTLAELNAYWGKVKPGGVIICHDTELEHPDASPPSDPPYPVSEAIRAWSDDKSVTIDWVSGCYGLAVIYVPTLVKV